MTWIQIFLLVVCIFATPCFALLAIGAFLAAMDDDGSGSDLVVSVICALLAIMSLTTAIYIAVNG